MDAEAERQPTMEHSVLRDALVFVITMNKVGGVGYAVTNRVQHQGEYCGPRLEASDHSWF